MLINRSGSKMLTHPRVSRSKKKPIHQAEAAQGGGLARETAESR